jgi:uncharacterized protein YjbI with pentapeptide repeats
MDEQHEFWQRPVTDTLSIEIVPGEQPRLLINRHGESVAQLKLSEARALIEVLNVAIGELFILQRDPTALSQVQTLLAGDITLTGRENSRRTTTTKSRIDGHIKGQELIRRYKRGERWFGRVDLRMADLEGADLREIDLTGADLSGANLRRANLFYATLTEANLAQANLEETGFFHANLRGADLSQAVLFRAYLSRADLTGARVTPEQLEQATVLRKANLPNGAKHE